MARPQRLRRICALPEHTRFGPDEGEAVGNVTLSLDEYEAVRLMDHESCTHEQCAAVMQVSRTTVTEIYAEARKKIAEAIVDGCSLRIEGGRVRVCELSGRCGGTLCIHEKEKPAGD